MTAEHPLLVAARGLGETVASYADETSRGCRLAPVVAGAFVDAGFYRMLVPRALGGEEVAPSVCLSVLETLATFDGSSAWCAMVGSTTGLLATMLEPDAARSIFEPRAALAGVFAPVGVGTPEGDGLRVKGRWPFASGIHQATSCLLGVIVPREGAAPAIRHVFVKPDQLEILETWNTGGLCGTGSHDVRVTDVLVPSSHVVSLFETKPRHNGSLYAFPVFGLLALGISAVSLGIARAALDAFAAVAQGKTPAGAKRTLAQRETVQLRFAEATASLESARAFVFSTIAAAEAEATERGSVAIERRAMLRLAAAHATKTCATVVDAVYAASGGSAVYQKHPLQRMFQDVHVAAQHAMIAEPAQTLAGKILLGAEADTTQL